MLGGGTATADLADVLAHGRARFPDGGAHLVQRLDPGDRRDRAVVVEIASAPQTIVLDTIEAQLGELMETRSIGRKLDATERSRAVARHLGPVRPEDYGTWVYYPWSRRLLHVLPRAEFDELRLSRNRNKITGAEQQRLRALDIAVVGLSVGRSTAVTLALEGIGGRFRLADFDCLELSNLNRIRDGVHALALNKAVLTAREIAEIDPYVAVEVFAVGVTPANLDEVLGGRTNVDIVVEECDDLEMKLRVRERARALRLPVVMETSDRGMIDVERFDLEPERPLFHGLVGELRADQLRGLDTYAKVPYVLSILGARSVSVRFAASMVDVDTALKTWPQLASGVALGGAVNADTIRRIALGTFQMSGRFYVDLDQLVAVDRSASHVPEPTVAPVVDPLPGTLALPELPRARNDWRAWARFLVAYATLAPSGGNAQPWRFVARPGVIECRLDAERATTLLDYRQRASRLACGASAANFVAAATATGWSVELSWPESVVIWSARLTDAGGARDPEVLTRLRARATNRTLGQRRPLEPGERDRLRACADTHGCGLEFAVDDAAVHELGEILAEVDRIRMLDARMHSELMGELRWTPRGTTGSPDGIELATLELDATQTAAMTLARSRPLMAVLDEIGGGHGLGRGSRQAAAHAAGFACLRAREHGDGAYGHGGFALGHLWMAAQDCGLTVQPMSALVYLFDRAREHGGGLDPTQIASLTKLHRRFAALFGAGGGSDLIVLRLGRAGAPSARSLRRAVDAVLQFTDDPVRPVDD